VTEAQFYTPLENNAVGCNLCPRNCIIEAGKFGNCKARRNRNGTLISEVYGKIAALNSDPVEKKPLYHFFPGNEILSIGTTGCNLHCVFCQNFALSQCDIRQPVSVKGFTPEELAALSLKKKNNLGVAFTYNEPTVNYEFMIRTAELVKQNNQKTVVVSNGYINPDPLKILLKNIDAFNIDLKAFDDNFYKKYSKASLDPVKNAIKIIAKSGKHLEITNLVIPTLNDDEFEFAEMCDWIAKETGRDTVLHLSRFFPRYELDQYPTPPETLFTLFDIAKEKLNYVYIGNMATELHSSTYCPTCKTLLIERTYYNTRKHAISPEGKCSQCGKLIMNEI